MLIETVDHLVQIYQANIIIKQEVIKTIKLTNTVFQIKTFLLKLTQFVFTVELLLLFDSFTIISPPSRYQNS